MAAEWYYTTNRQQRGPVSWDELCQIASSGLLRSSDLVWKDGMSDWAPATSQGLFRTTGELAAAGKAELRPRLEEDIDKPRRRSQMGRDERADDEDYDDRPRRRRRPEGMPLGAKIGLIAGGVILLLVIVGVTLFFVLREGGAAGVQDIPPQGLHINDALRRNDPRDKRTGSPSKTYQVKLIANSTYVIDHRSPACDAFLRLEDPGGREVAMDDDSGRGFGGGRLDARIVFTAPQSGAYRIIATSLRGGTGNFNLTVRKN